jgi:hypothetical protein
MKIDQVVEPVKKLAQDLGLINNQILLHLHEMAETQSTIGGACSIEAESAFHLLCIGPTLGKSILNLLEFAKVPASASGRFGSNH